MHIYVKYLGPFYLERSSLIPAWISKHIPSKVSDEITCSFPNFNGATVWEWISNHTFYKECNFLSMLGLKLIHVDKGAACINNDAEIVGELQKGMSPWR